MPCRAPCIVGIAVRLPSSVIHYRLRLFLTCPVVWHHTTCGEYSVLNQFGVEQLDSLTSVCVDIVDVAISGTRRPHAVIMHTRTLKLIGWSGIHSVLDPSDGVFGRFDLPALCVCHTLNGCCCCTGRPTTLCYKRFYLLIARADTGFSDVKQDLRVCCGKPVNRMRSICQYCPCSDSIRRCGGVQ